MKAFLVLCFLVFSKLALAGSDPGPVTFVQASPDQETATIYPDSTDVELSRIRFTANFPVHGLTTMNKLMIILKRDGPSFAPVNWNELDLETGMPVIDSTLMNLRVVDQGENVLISIPLLSDCVGRILTTHSYFCGVNIVPQTFENLTLRILVDVQPDAGRFAGVTYITELAGGYSPTTSHNVVGSESGTTDFAPRITQYGFLRPFVHRETLTFGDGFEEEK